MGHAPEWPGVTCDITTDEGYAGFADVPQDKRVSNLYYHVKESKAAKLRTRRADKTHDGVAPQANPSCLIQARRKQAEEGLEGLCEEGSTVAQATTEASVVAAPPCRT